MVQQSPFPRLPPIQTGQWAEKVGLGFALPEASEREQSLNCDTCDTKSITHTIASQGRKYMRGKN
jgi:hypothetical protein